MKLNNAFRQIARPRPTRKGSAGYDNQRDNIDPHIKTQVVSTAEGSVEHTPTKDNHITNKKYVDNEISAIPPSISDHGLLFGLSDDDHSQYYNISRLNSWLTTKDTDDLIEGTNNLYYDDTFPTTHYSNGSIIFSDGSSLTEDSSKLHWDNTNNRLGIGTTNPNSVITVYTSGYDLPSIEIQDGDMNFPLWTAYNPDTTPDTIGRMASASSVNGGLHFLGISSGNSMGIIFDGILSQTKPTASAVVIRAGKGSGGTPYALSDGEKIFEIRNWTSTKFMILGNGNIGLGTIVPTEKLDINSDAIRIRTAQTPSSASATGTTGTICWDSNYIYVCTATNTWKRTAISTW